MKNKKGNKYIVLGLLLNSTKYIFTIPYDIGCFISGLSISLIILGLYIGNGGMTRLKRWKRSLVKTNK